MDSRNEGNAVFGKPRYLSVESYSLLVLLVSSMLYSTMACFVKLAASTGILSTELVLLRASFQGIFVLLSMMCIRDPDEGYLLILRPFGNADVRSVVVARGIIGGMGFVFYYYTMTALPLGDATTLLSVNPVITVLAAGVFLDEPVRVSQLLATAASLVGSILIARPSFLFHHDDLIHNAGYPTMGYVTALLGACCGAAVYILIRRAGKVGVHTLQLLFSFCVFGSVFSFILCLILPYLLGMASTFALPQTKMSWIYVLGVCVFGSLGHLLMNFAARHAGAGLSSIIRSSTIVWSYILEILVFHQVPYTMTIFGVSLVLLSLGVITLEKHHHDRHLSNIDAFADVQGDEENLKLRANTERKGCIYGSTITDGDKRPAN